MKIGVISDVHGNSYALNEILKALDSEKCDEIIFTGDVVDMGPHSAECLHTLCARNDTTMLIGNHDMDFLRNDPIAKQFSHVPTEHKQYVFGSLTQADRETIAKFPLYTERICGGQKICFVHYACENPYNVQSLSNFNYTLIDHNPTAQVFDRLFANFKCDAVFFGHKHEPCDIIGNRLYVDVGSVGCHPDPLATGIIIDYDDSSWSYRRIAVAYNMDALAKDMETIPCGEQIYNFYFKHMHGTAK